MALPQSSDQQDPAAGPPPGSRLDARVAHYLRESRQRFAVYRRERRRASAAKRRGQGRKLTVVLVGSLVLLFALFGGALAFLGADPSGRHLSIDEARLLSEQGRINTATFLDEDNQIVGSYTRQVSATQRTVGGKPVPPPVIPTRVPFDSPVRDPDASDFYHLDYPQSGTLTASLEGAFRGGGARVDIDKQVTKARVRMVTTFLLPLMILANLFALLFTLGKGGNSAIGEVMTFGSIGKGKVKKGQTIVSFDDVGGAEEAVAELREVRDYLADPAKYEALGAAPPKGVLLFGPPGCGKTLLAKAVAGEAGVPFFSVAGAEFVESLVGVGAARVRDLFQRVRAAAPAIVFIDELDAAGRKRGAGGGGGGSDEREQTLNQLLVEMDGFDVSAGIVVIGATNRPDILDPALMRPGRFDRHITIERPEQDGRERILQIHAKGKSISPTVDFGWLAERTPGFTGADLANVVNEAALLAIRQEKPEVEIKEFEEAIMRVLTGPKRRGRLMSAAERTRAAYHESGHVVVAAAAGRTQDVERVSILTRGRAVATTTLHGDVDPSLMSQSQLRGQLITLTAGIAAEQLVLGEGSTGGEQDLEQATDLARDMVARYGMSPELGYVRLLANASEGFLDNDIPLADISYETRAVLDAEVRRFIKEALRDATAILSRHRATLDGLAARLEAEETLEGEELQEVLAPIRKEMASERITANGKARNRTAANGSATRRTAAKAVRHR